jgi:hypothetical protein
VNSSSHGAITLQDHEGTLFKVNGQSLKIFLELNEEFEYLDEIDFFCFPTNINFRPQWAVLGFLRISTQLEHLATKIVARRRGGGGDRPPHWAERALPAASHRQFSPMLSLRCSVLEKLVRGSFTRYPVAFPS